MEFNLNNQATECLNSAIINFHFNKKEKINTIRFCRKAIYKFIFEFYKNSKYINDNHEIQKNLLENLFESLEYYKDFILDLDFHLQEDEIFKYNKILNHLKNFVKLENYTKTELKKYNFTLNIITSEIYGIDSKKTYNNLNYLYKN